MGGAVGEACCDGAAEAFRGPTGRARSAPRRGRRPLAVPADHVSCVSGALRELSRHTASPAASTAPQGHDRRAAAPSAPAMSLRAFAAPALPHLPRTPRLAPRARSACTAAAPSARPGHLYLVSTPIGQLHDLSPRAASILRTATIVAAEDTRTTAALLRLANIPRATPPLSHHAHNAAARRPHLLRRLAAGASVALVSDAGTPCVCDPGVELVAAAAAADVPVVPVPGPCAALAALAASGLPAAPFAFLGFLPRAGSARSDALAALVAVSGAVVLYEAPHRLHATLRDVAAVAGDRALCVARELTKPWEEIARFSSAAGAAEMVARGEMPPPRGEYTLVLGPAPERVVHAEELEAYAGREVDVIKLVDAMVEEGVPVRTIAKCVARAADVPRKVVYAHATRSKEKLAQARAQTEKT